MSLLPLARRRAFLSQEIFADDHRGQTVVFRGELRTTDVADRAGLVLRVVTEGRLTPPRRAGPEARHDTGNYFGARQRQP